MGPVRVFVSPKNMKKISEHIIIHNTLLKYFLLKNILNFFILVYQNSWKKFKKILIQYIYSKTYS